MSIFKKYQKIILAVICCFFLTGVMMNILTMKTLQIGMISVFTCGILLTPINFACNDILSECIGEKKALHIILMGACINLFWAIITAICCILPGNNKFISDAFSVILGSTIRITCASIIAYIGGGWLNNKIMAILRNKDGNNKYYKRAILSTSIGQLFDDYVFVFIAFAPLGISAIENTWTAIATVPLVSAATETALECIVTPFSKFICKKFNELKIKNI